ncbi:MAG: enoyl-CoA hydratase-related protein [Acetobacteraceae bacterium]
MEVDGRPIESVSGGTHWGGGVLIHAEDQARIGPLILRRGEWNGKHILPKSWIAELLRPCDLNPNYGLLWWLNTGHGRYRSAPESSFFASGAGGNITWVAPEQDLVAVMRWIDPAAMDTFTRHHHAGSRMKTYETIKIEHPQEHTVLVTLNRPEVRNAMNTQMGLDLLDAFDGFCAAPNSQRCIVLTGAGRAFCAGGDLKQRNGMTDEQWQDQHLIFERAVRAIVGCPVPIIAAVNGPAFAGGMEMSLCCDFIYAAENARFALTEVTLGIMPGAGGTQNLPRAVGSRRAKEILLTGKPFTVREAFASGMVNRICKPDTLLSEALETAAVIAGNAPISTRQIKQSVNMGMNMDLHSAMMFEIEAYNRMVPTEDRREGIRAFNEKRKPVYRGR